MVVHGLADLVRQVGLGVQRRPHVAEPGGGVGLGDGERHVSHPQPGVALLVGVLHRPATPVLGEEPGGVAPAVGQVGDTAILGISPDKPAKQARFDTKYGLGFPLLADVSHVVAESYGAWGQKSMYGKKYMGIVRSAFLVDEDGLIASAWYNVKPKDTATNLLAAL